MQNGLERTVWHAVAQLERRSLEAWRKAHHPSLDAEQAFATFVNFVETTVTRKPQGRIIVSISVVGKRAFEGEVDVIYLQRTANRTYEEVRTD